MHGDDPNRIFEVEIRKGKSVVDLKKAIRKENSVTFRDCDADSVYVKESAEKLCLVDGHDVITTPLDDDNEFGIRGDGGIRNSPVF